MKETELKVIMVNEPSKEESEKKIKELCEFLKKTWPSINQPPNAD